MPTRRPRGRPRVESPVIFFFLDLPRSRLAAPTLALHDPSLPTHLFSSPPPPPPSFTPSPPGCAHPAHAAAGGRRSQTRAHTRCTRAGGRPRGRCGCASPPPPACGSACHTPRTRGCRPPSPPPHPPPPGLSVGRVDEPRVLRRVPPRRKRLGAPADGARKRAEAEVDGADVERQLAAVEEGGWARRARVGGLLEVQHPHVAGEVGAGGEGAPADGAWVAAAAAAAAAAVSGGQSLQSRDGRGAGGCR